MIRTLCFSAAALMFAAAAQAAPKAGDTLACASQDPAKRLIAVVGKVEPFGTGRTVANITLLNEAPGATPASVDHVPIDLEALAASCQRPADAPRPLGAHFEEGRQQWLEAVRTQGAGVFSISADQVDEVIKASIARAQQSEPKP